MSENSLTLLCDVAAHPKVKVVQVPFEGYSTPSTLGYRAPWPHGGELFRAIAGQYGKQWLGRDWGLTGPSKTPRCVTVMYPVPYPSSCEEGNITVTHCPQTQVLMSTRDVDITYQHQHVTPEAGIQQCRHDVNRSCNALLKQLGRLAVPRPVSFSMRHKAYVMIYCRPRLHTGHHDPSS